MNNFLKSFDESKVKYFTPVISVFLGLLVGLIILYASGYNGFEAYQELFKGSFGNLRRFGNTLSYMTPLIFTGLSVAFAFKTGLFNIGASGQFYFGGFVAVLLGATLDLPFGIHHIVVMLGGMIGGAFWGFIPGFLKAKFNIHEVVTSIMLNYTSIWVIQYFAKTLMPGKYETESLTIMETASYKSDFFYNLTGGSNLNLTFFIGIITIILIFILIEKTTFGFELKAVGFNKDAAKYSGMKVNRNIIVSMAIAGALAGLGGALYYTGYRSNINYGVLPSFGFDGIAVSLLALNSSIGVMFSSFLFGVLRGGGEFMVASIGIPKEIVDTVIAVIIYISAISLPIELFLINIIRGKKNKNTNSDKLDTINDKENINNIVNNNAVDNEMNKEEE
ncbi:MAG: ABC transporter permease [Lachnospirales bacterium]